MHTMRKLKTEYPPGSGLMRDGVSVEISASKEPWSEYELEDGSVIKARTVLLDCIRVEGEYDLEGNPIYVLKANGIMNVIPPDSLRRKKQ
jgi:hypothetical protein